MSQENCLRKGGRSYRFRQVGKCSPSGWDPRGAIPSSVIIMLRSSQTRRAPSSPLPAPCRLGLPQLHPLAIARGSAPSGSGGGKVFQRMLAMLHEPHSTRQSRQRAHSDMSHWLERFQLFWRKGGLARSQDTGFGWLLPCLPVPLHAATSGRAQSTAGMRELSLFLC